MAADPKGYGQYRGGYAPAEPVYAEDDYGQHGHGQHAEDPYATDIWHPGLEEGDLPPRRSKMGRAAQKLVNSAGALTSLALIVGLGIWGYKLAVRDVTGVPVIAALEGPARVAPENPGGELAQHTGLAVNTVAALGEAAGTADELRLAPRPTGLADEDLPMAEMGTASIVPRDTLAPVEDPLPLANTGRALPEPLPDEAPEPILEAPVVTDTDAAVALALNEVFADPEAEATAAVASAAVASADVIAASVPGVVRSLRPPPRPAAALPTGVVALAAADAAAEAALPGFSDIDPSTLPAGTRLVQLGAFDTEALARDEWNRIAMDFGPLMAGKGRVIQPAESAGRAFYRLRATGFGDLADARRFCAALVGKDLHCIPVQVR
ncbi:SPOR domain-containing protein [Frigidibacter albus]|uniref:SPOR domain-containing protein n=1 Tax=Frigidibacter albus TaxID=1465486 RepID=A0A6L8VG18_9RHOB|nr:SPOR domain-containing protein [Frigidibacter albus]MZQ89134.1 SPOR domain-containing protein [Frigidibacter albus]NBE30809.1 SPOR domain-containing protein [Frigidibacter albus]GGH51212.1 sporulation protein [Frigidibacter albus]